MITAAETATRLTPARRRLVETMTRLNFGRIENLVIRDGQPLFEPPPRILREVKFCAENGPQVNASQIDFSLKAQLKDMFAQFDGIRIGTVQSLQVKHGLPFHMTVEDQSA